MSGPIPITSAEGVAKVLGSRAFVPVNYAERHRALGAHLGFDVSEIVAAIDHIPLCQHGEAHLASRKRIAKLMAESVGQATDFIDNEVPEMVSRLLSTGPHDVMAEFVNPCVNRLISTNIGIPLELSDDTLVSRIFSQATGVAKRRRMNAELRNLRALIAKELPHLTDTGVGDRLALCILGTDALRGTLGRSLQAVFAGTVHTTTFPRTGVPYIDREVRQACPVDGVVHPAQAILRARLDQLEDSVNPENRNRFFGYGAHVCLGRKIALALWAQVQSSINDNKTAVEITTFKLRRDDVFYNPERFEIEVHDG